MLRTLRSITLLCSFCICGCAGLFSQEKKEEAGDTIALYQGFTVEIDAFSAVMSAINKDTYSFEGNVRVNLSEKYFPVVEFGFAGADRISVNDYGFHTKGFFTKIGIDYNLLKPNPPDTKIHRYFFIGARYAFSRFAYDVTNIWIDNGYWGEGEFRNYTGVKTTKHWMEVFGGLKVEVFRKVYMGWGLRLKVQLGKEELGEVSPWYIPGIGIKSVGNFGFSYTVGYRF